MAKSVNEVHLAGRAGKNAEVRYTSGGKEVVKFSLATGGGKKKDGSGEWPTDWHQVEAWDLSGASEVTKGAEVELWGRIKYDSWDDKKTGEKKYMTKIVATKIAVGGGNGDRPNQGNERGYSRGTEVSDSDIPF